MWRGYPRPRRTNTSGRTTTKLAPFNLNVSLTRLEVSIGMSVLRTWQIWREVEKWLAATI